MKNRNLIGTNGFNRCVPGREGYLVYNDNDEYVGRSVGLYGEYGEYEAQLLRQVCPAGGVAVEVGANIGTLTLVLSKAAGPTGFVYAYEPQRVVFQTLCANLAVNSIVNADARHAAAGAANGHVLIPDIDYATPNNFGGVELGAFDTGRKVRKVRLDDDLEPERLDLLKIDVEGMELEVLQGAATLIGRHRPILYVEDDRIEQSEALLRHIMGLDYRLYWHAVPLYNPENFFSERENFFGGTVSVNVLCVPRALKREISGLPEILDPAHHPMRRPAA